jgi:hypothetical protein
MRNRFDKWIVISLLIFLGYTSGIHAIGTNTGQGQKPNKEGDDLTVLSTEDKAQLIETLRLKKLFGSSIWPGFGKSEIPLIQYNERYAFLIGHPAPSPPWEAIDSDSFQGKVYYSREAAESQAFAVRVGDLWAGSLDTVGHMNRSMKEQIQEKIPPEKLTPAMFKMMEISPAYHIVALLHEAFHAFQATQELDRFLQAQGMYEFEKLYPFENEAFKSAWNKEGSSLISALNEQDETARLESIERFIEIRAKRRSAASLSENLIAFERRLEWLEGVAKYVEMQFAEKGSSLQGDAISKDYRIVWNRLQADFSFRIRKLGSQNGDLRFYLSGAAQAMILDQVSPGWKRTIMGRINIGLEDLLITALEKE